MYLYLLTLCVRICYTYPTIDTLISISIRQGRFFLNRKHIKSHRNRI